MNKNQQQSIHEDYEREQIFKDVGGWVVWMTNNPELAKKYFPEFTSILEKGVKDSPPHFTANIIQKLPENFYEWKAEIEKYSGKTRTKKIQEQIQLLELVLYKFEFETEIEQQAIESVKDELIEQLGYWESQLRNLSPQQTEIKKPKSSGKIITFRNSEIIKNFHNELNGYFPNKETELLKALQGKQLKEKLLFPHNANRFVEVFKRAKYNGFILSTPTEIKDWICTNFKFIKTQGRKKTVEDFKDNSVWDVLTKAKCEPSRKGRICVVDWLPFIPQDKRRREAKNEKL